MLLKRSADTALTACIIVFAAATLALVRPISIDLEVYASWLADPESYQFDQGFVIIGRFVRLVSDNVRILVFFASCMLQLAVLRCCLVFYPGALRFLFAAVGTTTYWHVSLSSNVVRNGMAVAIAALILTAGFGSRRVRFALSFTASVLTHWATFLYFLILWGIKPGQRIKLSHLLAIVLLFGSLLSLAVLYADLLGKLAVYSSTDVFTADRSSQFPRMLVQVALVLAALYFRIAPAELTRALWAALIILLMLAPFPEAFSRMSILTGVFLHVIYFGRLLSEQRISFPLKLLCVVVVAAVQILHPSTMTLLGLRNSGA